MNPIKPRAFKGKDGREVVLRPIEWKDLDDCLEFINSLVEEGAEILVDKKASREEEAEWLAKRLARTVKGEIIDLIAEVDGRMVANSEVEKRSGLMNHVGYLGIGVKADYRGIGIGTQIIQALKEESKKAGLKILVLDTFATNKTAQALYRKMGFEDSGRIPKAVFKNGKYIDVIRMTLEL